MGMKIKVVCVFVLTQININFETSKLINYENYIIIISIIIFVFHSIFARGKRK